MIAGRVDASGVPTIVLDVGGRQWPCTLDTGFNGDVELPCELRSAVNAHFFSRVRAQLAGGQDIEEECYRAQFPFDGDTLTVHASFALTDRILIGTRLLRRHRLAIDFPSRRVLLRKLC